MQGVILAAGKGSRLGSITFERSKAMLPIIGKPIIERVMEDIAINGVKDFILIVRSDDLEINNYFHAESKLGVNIHFVVQPESRGMADALSCAAPFIHNDFILSACDNLISEYYVQRMLKRWHEHSTHHALLTLMTAAPDIVSSSSAAIMNGDYVIGIVEKPHIEALPSNIACLPLYCFSHQLLGYLPKVQPSPRGEYELQDAIQMLIEDGGKIRGLKVENRLTLTNTADLVTINRHYLIRNGKSTRLDAGEVGAGTRFSDPIYIEAGTVIGSGCAIGPHVYIEKGCRIGNEVKMRDAVILRNSRVSDGVTIENDVFMS